MKNFKLNVFFEGVKAELQKVNWPTREDTIGTTMVVLVVVGIIAVYLGVVDAVVSRLAQVIIGS